MRNRRGCGCGCGQLGGWEDTLMNFGVGTLQTAAGTAAAVGAGLVEREKRKIIDKALGTKRRGGTGTIVVRQDEPRKRSNAGLYAGIAIAAASVLIFVWNWKN